MAFGEFKFGPLFMRLCYELGLEEMATATITDKVTFDNISCCYGNKKFGQLTNFL